MIFEINNWLFLPMLNELYLNRQQLANIQIQNSNKSKLMQREDLLTHFQFGSTSPSKRQQVQINEIMNKERDRLERLKRRRDEVRYHFQIEQEDDIREVLLLELQIIEERIQEIQSQIQFDFKNALLIEEEHMQSMQEMEMRQEVMMEKYGELHEAKLYSLIIKDAKESSSTMAQQ